VSSQTRSDLNELIKIEWNIIHDLKARLAQAKKAKEITRLSNSLGYHGNILSKLLQAKKEETPTDETTLEQLIAQLPKKYRANFRRTTPCKKPS
jgi:hypothetical protein